MKSNITEINDAVRTWYSSKPILIYTLLCFQNTNIKKDDKFYYNIFIVLYDVNILIFKVNRGRLLTDKFDWNKHEKLMQTPIPLSHIIIFINILHISNESGFLSAN